MNILDEDQASWRSASRRRTGRTRGEFGRFEVEWDRIVYRELRRRILTRAISGGYVVKPVTPESSEQAFDARCAIELGAAATTVGFPNTAS